MEGIAATSLMTAAARAHESPRPDRLFEDPWAKRLAGDTGRAFLERQDEVSARGPAFVVRHRFFDDFLLDAARQGIRQVVLVAAGLDTRAYRLTWPAGTRLYELDDAQVLAYKQGVLDDAGASPRCERIAISVDLREDWSVQLLAAGFRVADPTVWVAEGLLFYLPEPDVRSLLRAMASLSAPRSALGTDIMSATMLASEERRAWVQLYAESGAPFVFGTDEPAELVAACDWRPAVHSMREIAERFDRRLLTQLQPGPPPVVIVTATRP